ncbi:MAG: arylesterase [Rhizobiales bacterium]|nr:arylesterase [Hyphomicrobiales bacterium]
MAGSSHGGTETERVVRIIALGDSLTAGYLLGPDESFPAELERRLAAEGHAVRIVNAGVSGDTAGAGLQRFEWAVPDDADALIVELGANDALRGLPVAQTRRDLSRILEKAAERGLPVLLAGMEAPAGLGEEYANEFRSMYPDLATRFGTLLYPFFLEAVALDRSLNLDDGIHPNAEGIRRIVTDILPVVKELIELARRQDEAQ